MYATIQVEAIGHDTYQRMRLANGIMTEAGLGRSAGRIIGGMSQYKRWSCIEIDADGRFVASVRGRYDYRGSNSSGSRGVMCSYTLESGKRYRIKSPQSWGSTDTFTVHVTEAGDVVRE